jgi:hypothetical protein
VISDVVAERVVYELEAVQIHHEDRERTPLLGGNDDLALQPLAELRAVRELCQCILVSQLQDLLLALGDAGAHVIESLCEYPDLIAAMDRNRHGIVAAADAFHRLQQRIERSGNADRDQHAPTDRQQQTEQA